MPLLLALSACRALPPSEGVVAGVRCWIQPRTDLILVTRGGGGGEDLSVSRQAGGSPRGLCLQTAGIGSRT